MTPETEETTTPKIDDLMKPEFGEGWTHIVKAPRGSPAGVYGVALCGARGGYTDGPATFNAKTCPRCWALALEHLLNRFYVPIWRPSDDPRRAP